MFLTGIKRRADVMELVRSSGKKIFASVKILLVTLLKSILTAISSSGPMQVLGLKLSKNNYQFYLLLTESYFLRR